MNNWTDNRPVREDQTIREDEIDITCLTDERYKFKNLKTGTIREGAKVDIGHYQRKVVR